MNDLSYWYGEASIKICELQGLESIQVDEQIHVALPSSTGTEASVLETLLDFT